jgi:serine/threonine protein kinase
MKSISKTSLRDPTQLEQIVTERDILVNTRHPMIVSARFTFQSAAAVFFVLDYVPGGELFVRLRQEGQFSEERARFYAAEIMLGIGFLHGQGLVYRDLKPENILVDRDGHLKITDFGHAKADMDGQSTTSTFCGTAEYIAPEMLQGKAYTKAVDWWSFGIMLFEMLCGMPPFIHDNPNGLYAMIVNKEVVFPETMSPNARDLLEQLLEKDPDRRIGSGEADFVEIKKHPFFQGVDFDALLNKEIEPEWKPVLRDELDVTNFDQKVTAQSPGLPKARGGIHEQEDLPGFTYAEESQL